MTRFRSLPIDGVNVFFREAGPADAPTLVLLHGFPSSSHMFRDLIPKLAARFHVIAPDMVGFGYSDAPPVTAFPYTFEKLSEVTGKLLEALGVSKYSLYLHDYGGPIGFRLALAHPERVRALVVQNANAYMEGVSEAVAGLFLPLWKQRTDETEKPARAFLTAEATRGQYVTGTRDVSKLSPDAWTLDQALLDRPGQVDVQLALFVDYQHNVAQYDAWHAYLKRYQPPTLILWGKNDPFFLPAGAEAFRRDLPQVDIHYLDGGHFALEDHAEEVAQRIGTFADQVQGKAVAS